VSNCASDFAYSNEEQVYVILEDVCGTLKKPTGANRLYGTKPCDFTQDQQFIDDEQIRSSASERSPIKGTKPPGTLGIGTYIKPSGTLGVAPEADVLLQCLMGKKATPSTVDYTLENQLDSFSAYVLKGHTMFAFRGVVVQSASFNIAGNAIGTIDFSCQFMEQKQAGTAITVSDCATSIETIVMSPGKAQLYTTGMYVVVGDDDNTDAGYLITEVNYTNNTIKISPALAGAGEGIGATIAPWVPTVSAEVGTPIHGKLGLVTISGANAIVLAAKVDMNNNIKFYIDEKNNVWTAENFGRPKKRRIEGSVDLNFLKAGVSYFYRAEYQVGNALVIPCGNVAGYIVELQIPYAEYRTPKISGAEEFQQNVPFLAVASASLNDEFKIVYK